MEVNDSMASLFDIVRDLESQEREWTIYVAEPWSASSRAVVAPEPDDGSTPQIATDCGASYFIEVCIALEFLDGWRAGATPLEACERLVLYAINDA